jgi:hypothetical protein
MKTLTSQILTWKEGSGANVLSAALGSQISGNVAVINTVLADFVVKFAVLIDPEEQTRQSVVGKLEGNHMRRVGHTDLNSKKKDQLPNKQNTSGADRKGNRKSLSRVLPCLRIPKTLPLCSNSTASFC